MEYSGVLDVTNAIHLFTLDLIFIPRINKALAEFTEAFNNHKVRMESFTGHLIKCGQME